ncbi:MAG: glycoside hydrolase family 3 N-terminal domain-containing protein [Neobacillus sp.]
MRTFFRSFLTSILVLALILTGMPVSNSLAAAAGVTDLVIDLNVPQVTRDVRENKLDLNPLHVYEDGRFMMASENITWQSSNKNVASVSADGEVTLSGHNGKTFISVSDGRFSDRISIQYKGNQGEILVEKETGSRYDLIGHTIKHMTMEEKVGQMLMPDYRKWNGVNVTEMLPQIEQQIKDYHLGGVILFLENVVTTEQTTRLVNAYQEAAEKYNMLISIDQEGGIVTRLQSGTHMPGNMALGATRSEEVAEKVGRAIGEELHSLGINMNLAPVLDVNNNPDNPVIGVRSFGENPQMVGKMGNAYIKGLQASGTAATAKHFPGHGDTATDSHIALPTVPHDIERLKAVELYPFQQAMNAGIDAVMTAHVTFPKIDDTTAISKKTGAVIPVPATLSHKVLTGLMREEMGYNGLIITDAMNMLAIADHFGQVDAAIRTVKAGSDIVLMPVGLDFVANGLYDAVNNGEIPIERIEQSVERILTLKLNRGIVKAEVEKSIDEKIANALQIVGSAEHKAVEKEAAEKSITLVKNEGVMPLNAAAGDKIVVVGSSAVAIGAELHKHQGNITVINTTAPLSASNLTIAKQAKYIIVGTNTSTAGARAPGTNIMKLANQMITETEAQVIGIGIRNPYDIMAYPNIDAYLAQYGTRPASFEAAVNTIFGKNNPTGKLPVTIYNQTGGVLFGFDHGLGY